MSETTPFLYRPHRGGFAESMKMVKAFTTKMELVEEARLFYGEFMPAEDITLDTVHVEPYGFDDRIGWETHIVILEGVGPLGFTDRMVT